ncbi:hypothetical protein [truncated ORF], partial [Aspergillus niger]|uniref:Uncharacterized protein n=2 Tax=Aspergillus niger TaxID=5061 RepID=A0AAJ8BM93_ASPNG
MAKHGQFRPWSDQAATDSLESCPQQGCGSTLSTAALVRQIKQVGGSSQVCPQAAACKELRGWVGKKNVGRNKERRHKKGDPKRGQLWWVTKKRVSTMISKLPFRDDVALRGEGNIAVDNDSKAAPHKAGGEERNLATMRFYSELRERERGKREMDSKENSEWDKADEATARKSSGYRKLRLTSPSSQFQPASPSLPGIDTIIQVSPLYYLFPFPPTVCTAAAAAAGNWLAALVAAG